MTAAERALFAEHMREAEAEHAAYADEGGTPPYKHARDVALACRLAAMVAEPDDSVAFEVGMYAHRAMRDDANGWSATGIGRAALTALLTGAAEEAQT